MLRRISFPIYWILLTALMILLSDGCRPADSDDPFRDAVERLNESLSRRDYLIRNRGREIEALKDTLRMLGDYGERVTVQDRLLAKMRHYNVDSTLKYHDAAREEAIRNGDNERAKLLEIKSLEVLPLKIRIHEALIAIDSVDTSRLSEANRKEFFRTARQICLYLTSIYSPYFNPSDVNSEYLLKMGAYSDSLIAMMDETEEGYRLYAGTSHILHNNLSLSIATLLEELESISLDDPSYPEVTSMLGLSYFLRGRDEDWAMSHVKGATAECEQVILDGEMLRQISRWIYNTGDATTAFDYIIISEDNWARSGATVRNVHVPDVVPLIGKAFRNNVRSLRIRLGLIVGCLVVILALVCVIFYRRARDRAKLAAAKDDLAKANITKEIYLGRFLDLCYIYMDKMEEAVNIVSRKLAAGQFENLYQLIKTGRIEDEQRQLFYKEFDDAFIHIYPTFIEDVNRLMKEEYRFPLNDGKLTPELRILAFMRLGIDDSSKIARFLNLSVNTIYTYRNRMKNHAVNRDEFERKVMRIGHI